MMHEVRKQDHINYRCRIKNAILEKLASTFRGPELRTRISKTRSDHAVGNMRRQQ